LEAVCDGACVSQRRKQGGKRLVNSRLRAQVQDFLHLGGRFAGGTGVRPGPRSGHGEGREKEVSLRLLKLGVKVNAKAVYGVNRTGDVICCGHVE
jgi:hypothetical protein